MKKLEFMTEEWRVVLGGYYEASDLGRVRRKVRYSNSTKDGIIKQRINCRTGRPEVPYSIHNKKGVVKVHKLVAEAFLGVCPIGCEVNHKDGNKTNNHANNLEYITKKENNDHATRMGLHARGASHGLARLTPKDVRQIRLDYSSGRFTQRLIGEKFGVSQRTIFTIVNGITWSHTS